MPLKMEVLLTPKYFFAKIIFAPVQNGCEQKMLVFSQALKPIKWQDLLEEGKNSSNAFPTCARIRFSEKIILGLLGVL